MMQGVESQDRIFVQESHGDADLVAALSQDASRSIDLNRTGPDALRECVRGLTRWMSVVYLVRQGTGSSLSQMSAADWTQSLVGGLEPTLETLQILAGALMSFKGRIVLVWHSGDEPECGGTVQAALNGAYTAMVKSYARDLAPRYIGFNGLVVRPGVPADTIGRCAALLASAKVQSMIGQIVRPGLISGPDSWSPT